MVKDLVCGMEVDPRVSDWSREIDGATYHFCSERCFAEFNEDPHRYIGGSGGHDHGGGHMGGCCGAGGGAMGYVHLAVMIAFLVLAIIRSL